MGSSARDDRLEALEVYGSYETAGDERPSFLAGFDLETPFSMVDESNDTAIRSHHDVSNASTSTPTWMTAGSAPGRTFGAPSDRCAPPQTT